MKLKKVKRAASKPLQRQGRPAIIRAKKDYMVDSAVKCKFKEKDRVRRVVTTGSLGTVKEVRFELENSGLSEEARQKGAMVGVHWDSGTFSYLAPDALEIVNE